MASSHNDLVYDAATNTWRMPDMASDPAHTRAAQRQRVTSAMHSADASAHKAAARAIAQHLEHIEGAASPMIQANVRAHTGPQSTFDQRQTAAQIINQNYQVAADEAQAARDQLAQLRPSALASIVPAPGASEAAIFDRKADIMAALEATGKRGAQAQAEQLVKAAVASGDTLTINVLCGDPLRLRAAALGIDQQALTALYAQLQFDSEGPHPLRGSAIPSAELIHALNDGVMEQAIDQHVNDAQSTLVQLAKERGLA